MPRGEEDYKIMAKTITLHGHNYTVVNPNTTRAQNMLRNYLRSSDATLDEAYGRYSRAKANAYEYCRDREREFNSYDGVVASHNTCQFSYAFTGYCEGKKYLVYITKDAEYAIDYEAL